MSIAAKSDDEVILLPCICLKMLPTMGVQTHAIIV